METISYMLQRMKYTLTFFAFLLTISITVLFAQDTISTDQADSTGQAVSPKQATSAEPAVQPKQKKPRSDRLYFGGYFNLSLGKYTLLGIEPMVGFKLTQRLSVGAKIRYDYISDKRYSETYNASNYGASLFTRFNLKRIYLHAEYAGYNYKLYNELGNSHREWIPFLFLGAGFSQRLGGRTSLNAQILFDVLHDDGSPYGNWEPFYSIGIGVGF